MGTTRAKGGWGRARSIQTHIYRGPEGEEAGDEEKETERERSGETGRKDTRSYREPRQRWRNGDWEERQTEIEKDGGRALEREGERACEIEANTKGITMTLNPSYLAFIKAKVRALYRQEP